MTTSVATVASKVEEPMQQSVRMDPQSDDEDCDRAGGQGDIQPVGHDYVEEVTKLIIISSLITAKISLLLCILLERSVCFRSVTMTEK